MADIRNPVGGSSLAPQARAPVRSDAVRAAQRAFFDAALNGTASAPAAQPRAFQGASAAAASSAAAPSRILRPGSLLDIKV